MSSQLPKRHFGLDMLAFSSTMMLLQQHLSEEGGPHPQTLESKVEVYDTVTHRLLQTVMWYVAFVITLAAAVRCTEDPSDLLFSFKWVE